MADTPQPSASILPKVQAMLQEDGLYIGGDTKTPGVGAPMVVIGGKVYTLQIDSELDPTRFLPTLTLKGPYHA